MRSDPNVKFGPRRKHAREFDVALEASVESAVEEFEAAVKQNAILRGLKSDDADVLHADYLAIARDGSSIFFVYVERESYFTVDYFDFSGFGLQSEDLVANRVTFSDGELVHIFSIPEQLVTGNTRTAVGARTDLLDLAARDYIANLVNRRTRYRTALTVSTGAVPLPLEPSSSVVEPPELAPFLAQFRAEFPASQKTAFIMMKFADTHSHKKLLAEVERVLKSHGIVGLRADHREYSNQLYPNIRTYMHGCNFGVAIFDRWLSDEFNPNVALEVGYMLGLGKQVCFLKDKTLQQLHSDLAGSFYKIFDPQNMKITVQRALDKWLKDKGFASKGDERD